MSVDQTFHTPSFGDEEFDIPPLTYAPTAAASRCAGRGVFANQVPAEYLKRRFSCDPVYVYLPRQEADVTTCRQYEQHHIRPSEHILQQQRYAVPPQGQSMHSNQFHGGPQPQQSRVDHYQNDMHIQYDEQHMYNDTSMQPHQMAMMPQNHMMGPPQQVFSTISQSQISSQLGLQVGTGNMNNRHGLGSAGGSPPTSNQNSPNLETSEDSDDSTPLTQLIGTMKRPSPEPMDNMGPKAMKKAKAPKKKKKRDPNEPQKPVSAYALFFRDTQAAIKGQNPNASFGEVSKIVASMWESLDVEHKNSYKKKTETAKKDYLKALAAYRATLVSKAAVDQSDVLYGNNMNSNSPSSNSSNSSPPGHMMSKQSGVVDNMMNVHAQNQQSWHMQSPQHMTNNNSPPHAMQSNNGMVMQQQMDGQIASPPQMGMVNNRSPSTQMPGSSPHVYNSASNSPTYMNNTSPVSSGGGHSNMSNDMMVAMPTCLRNGCSNLAIDSPDWDREYCSSECVVSHCKDVFATWVAQRQAASSPYSTVK